MSLEDFSKFTNKYPVKKRNCYIAEPGFGFDDENYPKTYETKRLDKEMKRCPSLIYQTYGEMFDVLDGMYEDITCEIRELKDKNKEIIKKQESLEEKNLSQKKEISELKKITKDFKKNMKKIYKKMETIEKKFVSEETKTDSNQENDPFATFYSSYSSKKTKSKKTIIVEDRKKEFKKNLIDQYRYYHLKN